MPQDVTRAGERPASAMTVALPINIDSLLRRRPIESERVEYKAGWNSESVR